MVLGSCLATPDACIASMSMISTLHTTLTCASVKNTWYMGHNTCRSKFPPLFRPLRPQTHGQSRVWNRVRICSQVLFSFPPCASS